MYEDEPQSLRDYLESLPDVDASQVTPPSPMEAGSLGDQLSMMPDVAFGKTPYQIAQDDPDMDEDSFWGDIGNLVMRGGANLGKGAGWLLSAVGFDSVGDPLMEAADNAVDYWNEGVSGDMQQELAKSFFTLEEGGSWWNPADWERGEAGWKTAVGMGAESLLGTFAGMGIGGGVAKGLGAVWNTFNNPLGRAALKEAMVKGGVAGARAKKYSKFIESVHGAVGFGVGEGLVGGVMSGANVWDSVMGMSHENLMEGSSKYSQYYNQTADLGLSEEERINTAKEYIADQAASKAGWEAGIFTAMAGAPMGAFFGRVLGAPKVGRRLLEGGRAKTIVTGALGEMGQEALQSAEEQRASNVAIREYADASQEEWAGVFEAAVGGAIAGALMGGGFTLMAPTTANQAQLEAQQDAAQAAGINLERGRRVQEAAGKTAEALINKHDYTEQGAVDAISPIIEKFTEDENIRTAISELRYLEETGSPRTVREETTKPDEQEAAPETAEQAAEPEQEETTPEAEAAEQDAEVVFESKRGDKSVSLEEVLEKARELYAKRQFGRQAEGVEDGIRLNLGDEAADAFRAEMDRLVDEEVKQRQAAKQKQTEDAQPTESKDVPRGTIAEFISEYEGSGKRLTGPARKALEALDENNLAEKYEAGDEVGGVAISGRTAKILNQAVKRAAPAEPEVDDETAKQISYSIAEKTGLPWKASTYKKAEGDLYISRHGAKAGTPSETRQSENDIALTLDKEQLDPAYVKYLIQYLQPQIAQRARGTAQQAIRKSDIDDVLTEYFQKRAQTVSYSLASAETMLGKNDDLGAAKELSAFVKEQSPKERRELRKQTTLGKASRLPLFRAAAKGRRIPKYGDVVAVSELITKGKNRSKKENLARYNDSLNRSQINTLEKPALKALLDNIGVKYAPNMSREGLAQLLNNSMKGFSGAKKIDEAAERAATLRANRERIKPAQDELERRRTIRNVMRRLGLQARDEGYFKPETAGAYTPEELEEAVSQYVALGEESPYFKRWAYGEKQKAITNENGDLVTFYHAAFDDREDHTLKSKFGFVSLSENASYVAAFKNQQNDTGKHTMAVYARVEKAFDYSEKGQRRKLQRWLKSEGLPAVDDVLLREGRTRILESADVQRFLKENGYDAFYTFGVPRSAERLGLSPSRNIHLFNPDGNIKYADFNAGTFDGTYGPLNYSLARRGSENIFHSPLAAWLGGLKQPNIPLDELANGLTNPTALSKKGIKKFEVSDTGILDWIAAKKSEGAKSVPVADVLEFVNAATVQFKEVERRFMMPGEPSRLLETAKENVRTIEAFIEQEMSRVSEQAAADFSQQFYATNGNILFNHLPPDTAAQMLDDWHNTNMAVWEADYLRTKQEQGGDEVEFLASRPSRFSRYSMPVNPPDSYREFLMRVPAPKNADFTTHHWKQSNVILHFRVWGKVDTDGQTRTMYVEEIQSDWHQEGYLYGYTTGTPERGQVPNAPYTGDIGLLGLKRIMRYAAENGYNRVAWTAGEIQRERYDSSSVLNRVEVTKLDNDKLHIRADAETAIIEDWQLPKYIGHELARIYYGALKEKAVGEGHVLEGSELSTPAAGLVSHYDKKLKKSANKYLRPHKMEVRPVTERIRGQDFRLWEVRMTPEFRDQIVNGTQPLYSVSDSVYTEINRRLEVFQIKNYLIANVKKDATPATLRRALVEGVRRGFFTQAGILHTGVLDANTRDEAVAAALKRVEGRQAAAAMPLAKSVAQGELAKLTYEWTNAPEYEVHESYMTLPPYLVADIAQNGFENVVEGVIDPATGIVHIVSGNIHSIPRLHRVFFEEALGHHGLSEFFGEELDPFLDGLIPYMDDSDGWRALLRTYSNLAGVIGMEGKSHDHLMEAEDLYGEVYRSIFYRRGNRDKTLTRRIMRDDINLAKRQMVNELLSKMDVDQTTWQKFVAWVREWMRKHGWIHAYTENDLRRVMGRVHNNVMNGRTPHPWGKRNTTPVINTSIQSYSLLNGMLTSGLEDALKTKIPKKGKPSQYLEMFKPGLEAEGWIGNTEETKKRANSWGFSENELDFTNVIEFLVQKHLEDPNRNVSKVELLGVYNKTKPHISVISRHASHLFPHPPLGEMLKTKVGEYGTDYDEAALHDYINRFGQVFQDMFNNQDTIYELLKNANSEFGTNKQDTLSIAGVTNEFEEVTPLHFYAGRLRMLRDPLNNAPDVDGGVIDVIKRGDPDEIARVTRYLGLDSLTEPVTYENSNYAIKQWVFGAAGQDLKSKGAFQRVTLPIMLSHLPSGQQVARFNFGITSTFDSEAKKFKRQVFVDVQVQNDNGPISVGSDFMFGRQSFKDYIESQVNALDDDTHIVELLNTLSGSVEEMIKEFTSRIKTPEHGEAWVPNIPELPGLSRAIFSKLRNMSQSGLSGTPADLMQPDTVYDGPVNQSEIGGDSRHSSWAFKGGNATEISLLQISLWNPKQGRMPGSVHYGYRDIVHMRLRDNITEDGKKVLALEETQSDWASKYLHAKHDADQLGQWADKHLIDIYNGLKLLLSSDQFFTYQPGRTGRSNLVLSDIEKLGGLVNQIVRQDDTGQGRIDFINTAMRRVSFDGFSGNIVQWLSHEGSFTAPHNMALLKSINPEVAANYKAAITALMNVDKQYPHMPWIKKYVKLALYAGVAYARENGYDYVAWPHGADVARLWQKQESKEYWIDLDSGTVAMPQWRRASAGGDSVMYGMELLNGWGTHPLDRDNLPIAKAAQEIFRLYKEGDYIGARELSEATEGIDWKEGDPHQLRGAGEDPSQHKPYLLVDLPRPEVFDGRLHRANYSQIAVSDAKSISKKDYTLIRLKGVRHGHERNIDENVERVGGYIIQQAVEIANMTQSQITEHFENETWYNPTVQNLFGSFTLPVIGHVASIYNESYGWGNNETLKTVEDEIQRLSHKQWWDGEKAQVDTYRNLLRNEGDIPERFRVAREELQVESMIHLWEQGNSNRGGLAGIQLSTNIGGENKETYIEFPILGDYEWPFYNQNGDNGNGNNMDAMFNQPMRLNVVRSILQGLYGIKHPNLFAFTPWQINDIFRAAFSTLVSKYNNSPYERAWRSAISTDVFEYVRESEREYMREDLPEGEDIDEDVVIERAALRLQENLLDELEGFEIDTTGDISTIYEAYFSDFVWWREGEDGSIIVSPIEEATVAIDSQFSAFLNAAVIRKDYRSYREIDYLMGMAFDENHENYDPDLIKLTGEQYELIPKEWRDRFNITAPEGYAPTAEPETDPGLPDESDKPLAEQVYGAEETAEVWHALRMSDTVKNKNLKLPYSIKEKSTSEELSIINRKIARSHSDWTIADRVSHWLREMLHAIKVGDLRWSVTQGMLDGGASLKRWEREIFGDLLDASESPYKMYAMTKNLPSVMAAISKVGIPELRDGAFQPVQGRKGLVEILRPLHEHPDGNLVREWEGYAAARRSNELIQQDNPDGTSREKLFTQAEIDKLLALEEKYPFFKQIFNEWQEFNNQLLDLAERHGVITAKERVTWQQNDYVPFYRATESINNVDQRTGWGRVKAGVSGQKFFARRLTGSERELGNVIENIWFNTATMIDKIYKNEAMNRIVDAFDEIGMTKVDLPWESVRVTNEQLAQALGRAGLLAGDPGGEYSRAVNRAMAQNQQNITPQGWLSAVEKMTPEQKLQWNAVFRRVAPVGDNIVSVSRNGKLEYYEVEDKMLLRTLQNMEADGLIGLMKAMGISKSVLTRMVTIDPGFIVANWMRDTLSAWVTSDANMVPVVGAMAASKDIWKEEGEYIKMMMAGAGGGGFYDLTGGNVVGAMRKELGQGHWVPKLWRAYLKLGAVSENSNRIAIAKRIQRAGGSAAEAMYQAQDILNFTMSGDYPMIKFLIRTVPFLNARLQGLYRLGRGAKDHPIGFMLKGAAITMATLGLLARNWGDDDYERLEEWQKDLNWNILIDGKLFTIPRPFEVGLIFGTMPERFVRALLGRDDLSVSKERLRAALLDTLAFNPIPQMFKPMYELGANTNTFTGNPIVNQSLQGLEYPYQYDAWTSEFAKRVGRAMPDWSGPFQSPKRIQHALRAYLGTIGLYGLDATDYLLRQVSGDQPATPTKRWYERPVVRRFAKGDMDTSRYNKYAERLYKAIDESNRAFRTVNAEARKFNKEEARQLAQDRKQILAARPALNDFNKYLRDINAQMRAIRMHPTMEGDEKRRRLDQLTRARNRLLNRAGPLLDDLQLRD